jgi:thymidylate kinase
VIALTGPEASGKSTTASELCSWLRGAFASTSVHVGKPRSSWMSYLPRVARRLLKRTSKHFHSGRSRHRQPTSRQGWLFAFASLLLARDRTRACKSAFRDASRGHVVVCDRYPNTEIGTIDGPRIDPRANQGPFGFVWRWLSDIELGYYRGIPRPDICVQLSVPVDVAIRRNQERVKKDKETDEYLVERHLQFAASCASSPSVIQVDTARPRKNVMLELKRMIWRRL